METEIQNAVETYKDLALIPSPTSAVLRTLPEDNLVNVYSTWSIQDLIRSESTKFTQEFLLRCDDECKVLSRGIPNDTSSVVQHVFTKSRNRIALLRKSPKKDESVIFLEIWNLSQKECTFDLNDRKEHGKVYDHSMSRDSHFVYTNKFSTEQKQIDACTQLHEDLQSLKWSSNEKFLLYIAEAKQKKSESFFKDIFCEKNDQKPSEEITKGEENLYRESWGESYSNAHHCVLCIFEVATGKVDVLNLNDKFPNTSVAQATWGPDDETVVFVGYQEDPSRLGLVYCNNRRSSIFSYNLESKDVEYLINDENVCVEYPVFSPDFQTLIFLQHIANGPHQSCRKLMKYEWKSKKISTVIDLVNEADEKDFAGFYSCKLSSNWWSSDSHFFFFHTFRRSYLEIFYIDILSSKPKVEKICVAWQGTSYGSCQLLDVKDPYILVSVSSPNIKPHLMIGYFPDLSNRKKIIWNPINEKPCTKMEDLSWNVYSLSPSLTNKVYPNINYDILTIFSNKKQNGVLIIFPHGGPHSVFPAGFYQYAAAFARLGFIVCKVNYRGSIGYGENGVLSLPGNIGSQDVSDVIDAIEYLKQKDEFQIKHIVGFGGSHGGFLITHLIGQYPDLLKAAVIRNPVIDLGSMAVISDIPDWCWIECGLCKTYNPLESSNPNYLKEMWEKSPIKYIKHVKTPTLLCLGKNDLRVPSSQGLFFHRYLRAQNVPSKVFFYDDNHALSKTAVTSDVFVQTILWFQTYL